MSSLSAIRIDLIYPCNEKHIKRFTEQFQLSIFQESKQLYEDVHLRLIEKEPEQKWIRNILEGTAEQDRVRYVYHPANVAENIHENIHVNTGFSLVDHPTWQTGSSPQVVKEGSSNVGESKVDCQVNLTESERKNMYLLAMVHAYGIRSIRDLRQEHLPLLKSIRDRSLKAIRQLFGVNKGQVRVFFHYFPSYYHLHVHFAHTMREQLDFSPVRCHLMDTVIYNLEKDTFYYRDADIAVLLASNHPVYSTYDQSTASLEEQSE
jgi:m7GpppX diphosphatase